MKILVTAATAGELRLFETDGGNVDILITGVGVPATMYHLQKRFHQMDYDFAIQAGLAGTYSSHIKLAETVTVNRDTFGDLGMEEKNIFQPITKTILADKNEPPFSEGWLVNENKAVKELGYKKVNAVTVNTVSDSEILKQCREQSFNPDIETMEGAAFHYCCIMENIPFVQLRTISNEVGVRDKSKWLLEEAVHNLNNELSNLITQLTNKQINL